MFLVVAHRTLSSRGSVEAHEANIVIAEVGSMPDAIRGRSLNDLVRKSDVLECGENRLRAILRNLYEGRNATWTFLTLVHTERSSF